MSIKSTKNSNRLINEKSPYLLQHAYNPVDWYPWSDETFELAKKLDKPVFLSVGYSTCHWCHVMAHESFEDKEIAELLNDTFINIKVDREERPDIDSVYMTVCQIFTGSGGWPLTILMTPDKKPFFAGTYFPKESRYGRPGLKELIPQVRELWKSDRNRLLEPANQVMDILQHDIAINNSQRIDKQIFEKAYRELEAGYDETNGGFSSAPKFPMPSNLLFLMRYYNYYRDEQALEMVENSLQKMRDGGIFDHIGLGFHRYSTDSKWLVPHFEKMLYDQALLALAYTEAWQITKKNNYRENVDEIFTYVRRNLMSPHGAFYSAEDADSEGVEGKFYVWSKDEITEALGEYADVFCDMYDVTDEGNFEKIDGKPTNIIHISNTYHEIEQENDIISSQLNKIFPDSIDRLYKIREERVHPSKDDKVLTDWNGLMIAAFAKAGAAFGNKEYIGIAEKAANFILNEMADGEFPRLFHRERGGEAGIPAMLDDYAFLIFGLLELFEATFNYEYLQKAKLAADYTVEHFCDKEKGGFFFTSDLSSREIVRKKELFDGAVPSGNSIMLGNLVRLDRYYAEMMYEDIAVNMMQCFTHLIGKAPSAYTQFLANAGMLLYPFREIIITGGENNSNELLEELQSSFIPNKIVFLVNDDIKKNYSNLIPDYLKNYKLLDGSISLYICENYVCKAPVTDFEQAREVIKNISVE